MGIWADSKAVTGSCLGVVKENKYLFAFPVVGGILSAIVALVVGGAALALSGITAETLDAAGTAGTAAQDATDTAALDINPVALVLLLVAGYLSVLVVQYFMAALVHATNEELHGRDSSFGAGLSSASKHLGPIAGWALITAIVGWIMSAIRGENSQGGGASLLRSITAGVLSAAWSVITFFVMPYIVLRGQGPISSIKSSAALVSRTWGNQIRGNIRIGMTLVVFAVLPAILLTVLGTALAASTNPALGIPVAVVGVLALIAASVVISALKSVFAVALFNYADEGTVVEPFTQKQLVGAFTAGKI